jgi:hypothetical protein
LAGSENGQALIPIPTRVPVLKLSKEYFMKKRNFLLSLLAAASMGLMGQAVAQTELRIGFFPGPYADQFKRGVQPYLESQGIKVTATEFSNIIQINTALMDGSLDANVFQNRAFMDTFNTQQKARLVEVLRHETRGGDHPAGPEHRARPVAAAFGIQGHSRLTRTCRPAPPPPWRRRR